jgi:hypothetical protein
LSSLVVFKRLGADWTGSPLAPFMQIVAIEVFEFSDGLHRSDFTLALFAFLPLGASRSHDKGDLLDQDGSILDF